MSSPCLTLSDFHEVSRAAVPPPSLPVCFTRYIRPHPLFTESLSFFIEDMISSNVGAAPRIIGIVFA
jgi:hypothetical protein